MDDEDPLFLQVKEAQASVLAPYAAPSPYANHGQRVVVGQRLIQGAPDIFLGWGEQDGVHYYVRQLRDMKGGLEFDPATVQVANFPAYCGLCGWALALAHAKSGDAALIAGYVGTSAALDESIAGFALAYADQTEQDHAGPDHRRPDRAYPGGAGGVSPRRCASLPTPLCWCVWQAVESTRSLLLIAQQVKRQEGQRHRDTLSSADYASSEISGGAPLGVPGADTSTSFSACALFPTDGQHVAHRQIPA